MKSWYLLLALVVVGLSVGAVYIVNNPEEGKSATIEQSMDSTAQLTLASSAFENGSSIPAKYTCDENKDLSPALSWSGVPEGAKSLALLMDDPDIPQVFKDQRGIDSFDHWVLFNISPNATGVAEGASVGVVGKNGAGNNAYTGPCPPPQYEPSEHRYVFRLYVLDTELPLQEGASKADVLKAMEGHIIAQAELIGTYKRK